MSDELAALLAYVNDLPSETVIFVTGGDRVLRCQPVSHDVSRRHRRDGLARFPGLEQGVQREAKLTRKAFLAMASCRFVVIATFIQARRSTNYEAPQRTSARIQL